VIRFFIYLFFAFGCFAQEKIFFLHVPKTGGCTFRSLLEDHYPVEAYRPFMNWKTFRPDHKTFQNLSLVHGHMLYSRAMPYCKNFIKITFLRDPVARVLSEHRFLSASKNNLGHIQHFLPPNSDPIDTAANIACMFLSQLDPLDPNISIEQHLESAKNSLKEFDFVGITEQMDESIALFFQMIGWKLPEKIPFLNTTDPSRSNDPQEILDAIAERNWADIELYRFAKELFEAKKQKIIPRILNKTIQWQDNIDYDFRGPLEGYGWCPREHTRDGLFRWIGSPERGCIDFPLAAGYNYSFEIILCINRSLLSKLAITINGKDLACEPKFWSYFNGHESFICKALIPNDFIRQGQMTRVEIAIHDPDHIPERNYYHGRCGCSKILIKRL